MAAEEHHPVVELGDQRVGGGVRFGGRGLEVDGAVRSLDAELLGWQRVGRRAVLRGAVGAAGVRQERLGQDVQRLQILDDDLAAGLGREGARGEPKTS